MRAMCPSVIRGSGRTGTVKRIRNASILESFFALFVLLLILFGVLQLYQFITAAMVTEYAAFRAARSSAVGFSDYLVDREARIKAIPVSGAMVEPYSSKEFGAGQAVAEQNAIERYMIGERYMDYEYWHSKIMTHKSYRCPLYGKPTLGSSCHFCKITHTDGTNLAVTQHVSGDTTTAEVSFNHYPLTMPLYEIFSKKGNITLTKSAELTNHASIFLDE